MYSEKIKQIGDKLSFLADQISKNKYPKMDGSNQIDHSLCLKTIREIHDISKTLENKNIEIKGNMRILILDDDQIRHDHFKQKYTDHDITHTYTVEETVNAIMLDKFSYIFLDHDLGGLQMVESGNGTGYEIAKFLHDNPQYLPTHDIVVHSLNPIGRKNMIDVLKKVHNNVIDAPGCWL